MQALRRVDTPWCPLTTVQAALWESYGTKRLREQTRTENPDRKPRQKTRLGLHWADSCNKALFWQLLQPTCCQMYQLTVPLDHNRKAKRGANYAKQGNYAKEFSPACAGSAIDSGSPQYLLIKTHLKNMGDQVQMFKHTTSSPYHPQVKHLFTKCKESGMYVNLRLEWQHSN